MRSVFRCLPLLLLLLFAACQSSKQSLKNARTNTDGVMDITISTMTKDALRVKGAIESVNGEVDKRNSFSLRIEEIVKYGPTFSSAEPKVGEVVTLLTPRDVTFEQGQVVILDVLTPKFDQGARPMRVRLGHP